MDTHDIAIAAAIAKGSGGGGGTGNYNLLENKPKINNVELVGNKSLDDIGVSSAIQTEVARIVADAPEDFDTLKEMSDWIATHEDDAAAMNSAIRQNASDISDLEDTKVDKVSGKGLSTNDYTTAEKTKLAGLSNYDDTQVRADIEALEGSRYTKAETDALLDEKQDALTSAQLAAANSGITVAKVAQYDDIYAVMNYSNLNHNGIFRGKDLTSQWVEDGKLKEDLYTKVHASDFSDLYLGDYFTIHIEPELYEIFAGAAFADGMTYYEQGGIVTARTYTATTDTTPDSSKSYYTMRTVNEDIDLMIAAFGYYYNTGDTTLNFPLLVLIPRNQGFATTAKMNETNTTTGGYLNSYMHQTVLPCYADSLRTALNNHLLSHRTILSNAVNTSTPSMAGAGLMGASSGWTWTTVELQLMNEVQVYGSTVWSSSAYDVGVDNRQLPIFKFITPVSGRSNFWLRSVVSSSDFAGCSGLGGAHLFGASNALYVRPLILFG